MYDGNELFIAQTSNEIFIAQTSNEHFIAQTSNELFIAQTPLASMKASDEDAVNFRHRFKIR